MTTRLTITIRKDSDRDEAHALVRAATLGSRVEFKAARRSLDQNSKFWALLHDVAEQVPWHGVKLSAEDFKYLFLDALKREVRLVPNIDGNGFVALGRSSSDLSVSEMSDLIELILMFGANHGVTFNESESTNLSGNSPVAPRTDDAPAVNDGPHAAVAAGAIEEASLLSDDWRDAYITTMTTPTTRAQSILSRHQTAVQMIGNGQPSARELEWMRLVAKLVDRRDKNRLRPGEIFADEIEKLRVTPLPPVEDAA